MTGYTGGDDLLVPISWEEDHVQSVLYQVKKIVDSNDKGPGFYINEAYGDYKYMLQKPFSESFEEPNEVPWEEHEKVFSPLCIHFNLLKPLYFLIVVQNTSQ